MGAESYIIGVDIGGTNIRIGAVDPKYNLCNPVKTSTKGFCGADIATKLTGFIANYIEPLRGQITAIAVGLPSTINMERTTVISTPNIEGLCNINLKAEAEKALNLPVLIEKDACMLVHYDLFKNNLPLDGIIIGVYFGTGLGNVILLNGTPLVGKNGVACELGHVPTLGGTEPCGCGLAGCLELYAAGRGLERICRECFPNCDISSIFTNYGQTPELDSFIQTMAKAVATEINILNPDIIVLGGGILGMEGFPIEKLTAYITGFTRKPLPADDLHFVISDTESPFNGVLGAAVYARKRL